MELKPAFVDCYDLCCKPEPKAVVSIGAARRICAPQALCRMVQRRFAEAGTFITHDDLPAAVCRHAAFQIYVTALRRMLYGVLHHIAESPEQMIFLHTEVIS